MQLTTEQFQEMEDKVLEWNVIFGNDLDDESLIPTYIKLCIEEGKEYLIADQEDNHVERIDALVDSVFTGFMLNRLEDGVGFGGWLQCVHGGEVYTFEACLHELTKENVDITGYSTLLLETLKEESKRYNLFGAFQRVYESNMSKAAPKTVDIAKEVAYIESQGRYADVFAEESGEYLIFKAKRDLQEGNSFEKGKVVKWSGFQSVEDLGGLEEFIKRGS